MHNAIVRTFPYIHGQQSELMDILCDIQDIIDHKYSASAIAHDRDHAQHVVAAIMDGLDWSLHLLVAR